MRQFYDANGNKVFISFEKHVFPLEPRHVLIICRFEGKWLLTDHPIRGLEFPGGKLEAGETVEEAAAREVYEETGGIIKTLDYIGEYYVEDKQNSPFVKAILYAVVNTLEKKENFMETNGPVLKEKDVLEEELMNPEYSFIMKDEVVTLSLAKLKGE
ncbi:RNA deprotection pyrophosphohydrolase [Lederbergia panacisoli]|uniref:RNA deprotection pyrophosphohydrolase n=1 Tax=Lederbergia panacisoli TaxID=1255251 RepID=UPI00214BB97B|nr:nucleoside triphosphatase YtkD [Lederbergia panacisoli]MCR2821771.1 nucleoside triphosphatase YtkD [Lederbergia panacisoli]